MTHRFGFAALLFLVSLAPLSSLLVLAAHAGAAGQTATAGPALAPDKGKFRILVGGQPAGKEEFEISQNGAEWIARGSSNVEAKEAGATRVTALLRLKADGTPVHYEWATEGGKKAAANVDFSNGTATIDLRLEGAKPFTQQFFFNTPRVVILDNNLFHHYAILARLYDWEKKGTQTFSVLVPQAMTPGSVTVEYGGPAPFGNAKYEMLRVRTEDLELDLYLDNQRLMRIVSSTANAEAIRE